MVPGWSPWVRRFGAPSAWRIPLNDLFDAEVIVFWEHVLILLMFLPLLVVRLHEIPKITRSTWGYLIFSGFAGSAVGTIFFTLALKNGNPTVVNVVLNIQPVLSTLGACLLFGDRLAQRFYLFAALAVLAGVFVSVEHPAHQPVLRAGRAQSRHRLRARLRALLGTIDRRWPRRDDWHVAPPGLEFTGGGWVGLHDTHSPRPG